MPHSRRALGFGLIALALRGPVSCSGPIMPLRCRRAHRRDAWPPIKRRTESFYRGALPRSPAAPNERHLTKPNLSSWCACPTRLKAHLTPTTRKAPDHGCRKLPSPRTITCSSARCSTQPPRTRDGCGTWFSVFGSAIALRRGCALLLKHCSGVSWTSLALRSSESHCRSTFRSHCCA